MVGPAGEQRLQDAGERALADGDAAGDADHVRHPRRHRAEERRRHPGEVLRRADVQVQQARQREVDGRHLVEVDALVDAAQLGEVVLTEGERGGRPQGGPVVATDREEPALGLDHSGDPRLAPCAGCNPLATARPASSAAITRPRRGSSSSSSPTAITTASRSGPRRASTRRAATAGSSSRRGAAWPSSAAGPRLVGVRHRPGGGRRGWRARCGAGGAGRAAPTPSPRLGRAARRVDVVVGNPPYLSQLAAATTRGGSSRHGGGPYADAAVEFLALAHRLARPDGGRIGLVLPQSILASRDAAPVRADARRVRPRSPGRGGRRRPSSTPRCWCARWSSSSGSPGAGRRHGPTSSRRASALPAAPGPRHRRHARRPLPAVGELPRSVLRAGAGRRGGRRTVRRSSPAGSSTRRRAAGASGR